MARKDAKPGYREKAAARRIEALELRKTGMAFQRIAEKLGISVGQAHGDVMAALKTLAEKQNVTADECRTLEIARLDAMLEKMWTLVDKSDQGAVDRILRIMERRARYLGLDAPEKIDTTSTIELKGYTGINPDDWDAAPEQTS